MEYITEVQYTKGKSKKIYYFDAAVREYKKQHYIVVEYDNVRLRMKFEGVDATERDVYVCDFCDLHFSSNNCYYDIDFKRKEGNFVTETKAIKKQSGLPPKLR